MNNIRNQVCLFLVLLGLISGSQGIDSSCTFKRQWSRAGRLCCHFSEDIGRQKRAFQIKRNPFSTAEKESEIILDCVWLKNLGLDCKLVTTKVFEFGNNVSNTVDIDIPALNSDYDGTYECVLVPPDGGHVSPCRYYDAEHASSEVHTARKPSTTTNETEGLVEKERRSTQPPGNDEIYIIVIIVMGIVAGLSITAVGVLIWVIRRREETMKGKRRQKSETVEDQPFVDNQ